MWFGGVFLPQRIGAPFSSGCRTLHVFRRRRGRRHWRLVVADRANGKKYLPVSETTLPCPRPPSSQLTSASPPLPECISNFSQANLPPLGLTVYRTIFVSKGTHKCKHYYHFPGQSLHHQPSPPIPVWQTRTSQAECEPGYYCVGGARILCPAGTFGSSPGLSSAACSGKCPAGYFCRAGLTEMLGGERCGGPRYYCPIGSAVRLEVGLGNYTVGESPDRRVAEVRES